MAVGGEDRQMKAKMETWKAAYYPKPLIESQRTKAILCLLFDSIACHFPVLDMAHGGGHGITEDFSDDPLVSAGIIELQEEITMPRIDELDWDDEENWEDYLELQVTAMALQECHQKSAVPITDIGHFAIPAFILGENDILRNAKLQAASIAVSSIEMVLPPIGEPTDEDILRLREELSDELQPFRRHMLQLAPLVREYLRQGATAKEVYDEAKYVTDTRVAPLLGQLRDRVKREKGVFWRRVLLKSGTVLPKFMMNWAQKNAISAALAALGDLSQLASSAVDLQSLIENVKREGGLGFLLSLEEHATRG